MAGLFDAPLGSDARERGSNPSIRLVKRSGGSFTVDAVDEVDVSVVLSEGASLSL